MKSYTFGWIQNPSDFLKLKKVVEIFDINSEQYKELKENTINEVIYHEDDRNRLQKLLDTNTCEFTYEDLVGTNKDKNNKAAKKRADAIANSLLQITIQPQNRNKRYTDNWTSDGFLRWAVSLNFVAYNYNSKVFHITKHGKALSEANEDDINNIMEERILAYPPANQILSILYSEPNKYHSKFKLGSKLGFQGEPGFTSYNEEVMFDYLYSSPQKEWGSIRSDVEGTADKYARMISNWLVKIGLVKPKRLSVKKIINDTEVAFSGYKITAKGIHTYRQSQNKIREKFVMWEFLATNTQDKDYVRTRRAYILKTIVSTKSWNTLLNKMHSLGFSENKMILKQDLIGLKFMGLNIEFSDKLINFNDKINDFFIPKIGVTNQISKNNIILLKENIIEKTNLPSQYYELVDIAYDGSRNRDFEIKTIELFREVFNVNASLLAGPRKPDGVISEQNYGIIIDTKAYKSGYSRSINQQDQMQRYVDENKYRDLRHNENEWWKVFNKNIPESSFYFLWISSKFNGNFNQQIEDLSYRTNVVGGALNVEQLLLGADLVNKKLFSKDDLDKLFNNGEIYFTKSY